MADGSTRSSSVPYGPEGGDQWIEAAKNVGQGAAQTATGVTGAISGDIAGLGALAYDATANAILSPFRGNRASEYADPTKVRDTVANALTYRADNQDSTTNKILQAPGKMIGGAGDYLASLAEKSGVPYVEHIARAVPLAAASYLGVKSGIPTRSKQGVRLPARVDTRPPPAQQVTPEQVAIKEASDIGLKLPPSYVGNKIGNIVEGASGRAPLLRDLSMENASVVNSAAGKAIGITDKPVTRATIGMEKAKANQAYADISKTGARKTSDAYRKEIESIGDRSGGGSFPDDAPPQVAALKQRYGKIPGFDAADAVARIKQLRADARSNYKTRDPDKAAIANVQQRIADALDNELARHVDDLGQPKLAADYKAARVKLAKLRTVEEALQGGYVSAQKIHQQWKRGAPLEGELLAIAKAYDNFPQALQNANKLAGTHPFSVVDYLVAAGSSAGAAFNPALLAGVAARPLARKALASDAYQRRFVAPKGKEAAKSVRQPSNKAAAVVPASNVRERRAQ
jgi:hypothetical protein